VTGDDDEDNDDDDNVDDDDNNELEKNLRYGGMNSTRNSKSYLSGSSVSTPRMTRAAITWGRKLIAIHPLWEFWIHGRGQAPVSTKFLNCSRVAKAFSSSFWAQERRCWMLFPVSYYKNKK
jgi:hypothetical protein